MLTLPAPESLSQSEMAYWTFRVREQLGALESWLDKARKIGDQWHSMLPQSDEEEDSEEEKVVQPKQKKKDRVLKAEKEKKKERKVYRRPRMEPKKSRSRSPVRTRTPSPPPIQAAPQVKSPRYVPTSPSYSPRVMMSPSPVSPSASPPRSPMASPVRQVEDYLELEAGEVDLTGDSD